MTRHVIALTLGPTPEIYAKVYRSRGMKVPMMRTPHDMGALIPLWMRPVHKAWAETHGYYWLPCVLCGREHGGHEITDSIPDPIEGPGCGVMICPYCTIERNTHSAPTE